MKQVHLQMLRLPGNDDIPLPEYQSDAASGMDVRAAVTAPVELQPGDIKLIPTGLKMAIDPGFEIQVRPRSGLALKHGITVANAPGTIDADYRGEVGVILVNLSRTAFTINRGERVAQLVVQEVLHAEVKEVQQVEDLGDTARGAGGFGSTGR